jgi:hypothetical protein
MHMLLGLRFMTSAARCYLERQRPAYRPDEQSDDPVRHDVAGWCELCRF